MLGLFTLPSALRHGAHLPSCHARRCIVQTFRLMTTNSTSGRTYKDALALLDTLQSNRAVMTNLATSTLKKNEDAIPEVLAFAKRAGYEVSDFADRGLRCIHVAGTKGKGSVCVMTENILLQYQQGASEERIGKRIGKIGTFTSPHLVSVRERMRIDGEDISEELFTKYFFELWDRFSSPAATSNFADMDSPLSTTKPNYFRYLFLMAMHAFMEEGIQTAIVECGIGGEYDTTNILPSRAVSVSATTLLGIDHTAMLGSTVAEIAWHKAGIMKKDVPVFSVEQVPEAKSVLDSRAKEKGVELAYVEEHPVIQSGQLKLGLQGDFQKDNASLAIAVASRHLQHLGISQDVSQDLPPEFTNGLQTVQWRARCQVRTEGNIQWLIDGAHTEDSIKAAAAWYIKKYTEAIVSAGVYHLPTMLIFNQQDRDAVPLLRTLLKTLSYWPGFGRSIRFSAPGNIFTCAAFCMNTPFRADVETGVDLTKQEALGELYWKTDKNRLYMCYGSVEEAVGLARKVADGDKLLVLVTGSLHLAGSVLEVLDFQKTNASNAPLDAPEVE